MAFYVDAEIGDTINIGETKVVIQRKTGRKTRLAIIADKDIPVRIDKNVSSNRNATSV